jgi:hypothetical protein
MVATKHPYVGEIDLALSTSIPLRKFAVLSLLAQPDAAGREAAPIVGMTRLQKLLFLIFEAVPRVSPDRDIEVDVNFEPQRFGPADVALYADLEFLELTGHIQRSLSPDTFGTPPGEYALDSPVHSGAAAQAPEDAADQELTFDYLMADDDAPAAYAAAEASREAVFKITPRGRQLLDLLLADATPRAKPVVTAVYTEAARVKAKYGDWALQQLLRYIYANYPDMITKSEIRDYVLGSR